MLLPFVFDFYNMNMVHSDVFAIVMQPLLCMSLACGWQASVLSSCLSMNCVTVVDVCTLRVCLFCSRNGLFTIPSKPPCLAV